MYGMACEIVNRYTSTARSTGVLQELELRQLLNNEGGMPWTVGFMKKLKPCIPSSGFCPLDSVHFRLTCFSSLSADCVEITFERKRNLFHLA